MARNFNMTSQKAKGNGHQSGYEPGVTGPGFFEGTFSSMSFDSAVKEFVHAGKDITDLLFRCRFRDEKERNAVIGFLHRCNKYHMDDWKVLITQWAAASDSVNAERMMKLLEAVIGNFRYAKAQRARQDRVRSYDKKDKDEE